MLISYGLNVMVKFLNITLNLLSTLRSQLWKRLLHCDTVPQANPADSHDSDSRLGHHPLLPPKGLEAQVYGRG